ncbi:MAG: molybdopterin-dependent oxidoreductase [Treponema sp.]|nr:molybdopterin-dependent oxidoreductase [Treponema sp.]
MLRKLIDKDVSRRTFIKGGATFTAAMTAVLTGLPLTSCRGLFQTVRDRPNLADGEWIPAACWHNCGGSKCLNKALVVDGIVIRQKTDDITPDTPEAPQQRACMRGFSQQVQALGADRLKYPMKRKNWQPGGGRKDLRGQDEWERITWDEAYDYIANEITRIKNTYGTESILGTGAVTHPVLTQLGTYIRSWGTISWGSWYVGSHLLGVGDACIVFDQLNDRFDMQNSELCIAFGINPAWSTLGNATNFYLDMKKNGCEFILIDPVYTDSAALLDAEWIPSRPGTDMPLILGLCYAMLDQDDPASNPLIDWDFLNRYTVGFDADHMPDNARINENFRDYLLGAYDNTPKTPEWASRICGVAPGKIRELAQKMGKNTRLSLITSWAGGRSYDADSLPQLFLTLGMMGGHFGKSGHCCGVSTWNYAANFGPRLVTAGGAGMTTTFPTNPVHWLNDTECWPAVLGEPFNPTDTFVRIKGWLAGAPRTWKNWIDDLDLTTQAERINPNIQMIWHSNVANLQTRDGAVKGIEAHRSVEFVVSQNSHLTTNAKYSDIVLPVTTEWEREGRFLPSPNREVQFISRQVISPLYESKHDEEIMEGIAARLGLDPAALYPVSPKQRFFNALRGARVVQENGRDFDPLLTITRADIRSWGVTGEPQAGRVGLNKFLEDGKYQVMRHKGDNYGFIAFQAFIDDPENNPLYTTTGKFEIYSQTYADVINSQGYARGGRQLSPLPKYVPHTNGYESTFTNFQAGIKGAYPYQLINLKYQRRSHSVFDNIPWLREAFANPFYISAADAREKGIADGDFVLITSAYGRTVRPAYVTERFMPGVCALPHGAWIDVDETTGIDKAGADNYIVGNHPTGQGVSGWTTQIVNFEKWTGAPLAPDADLPLRIIF